ncbi:MAG: ferrochelatase [Salibacteraceae bacterium]
MAKTGVLLINLGTPDDPSVGKVRKYLFQFLNDPRVIDLPWLARAILVNLIIVPFRSFGSSKIYKELWTDRGSPLLFHGEKVRDMLQVELGSRFQVELAMRYGQPSIPSVLRRMRKENYKKLILVPMFPQYASASNGSAMEAAMREIASWWVIPELAVVSQFHNDSLYLEAFAERGRQYDIASYDHVLFSYHGLPIRHVDKVYGETPCSDHNCEHELNEDNKYCYKATCFATTRALAEKLNIPREKYTVCFQSRLDRNWLEPFSDKVVEDQAKQGAKRLLVFSPAFVADCLETTVEIGSEYVEIFEEHGGHELQLVESLNDHPLWVQSLKEMVLARA